MNSCCTLFCFVSSFLFLITCDLVHLKTASVLPGEQETDWEILITGSEQPLFVFLFLLREVFFLTWGRRATCKLAVGRTPSLQCTLSQKPNSIERVSVPSLSNCNCVFFFSISNIYSFNCVSFPVHPQYVLAVGSSVFHAMFYGELAENKDEIHIPDVEPAAFLAMLKWGSSAWTLHIFFSLRRLRTPYLHWLFSKMLSSLSTAQLPQPRRNPFSLNPPRQMKWISKMKSIFVHLHFAHHGFYHWCWITACLFMYLLALPGIHFLCPCYSRRLTDMEG